MNHSNFNLFSFLIFASWIHIDFLFVIVSFRTSFCKNFHIYCWNEQCENFLHIYTWRPFQWCVTFPIWSSLMHTFLGFNYAHHKWTLLRNFSEWQLTHFLLKWTMWFFTHLHMKTFPMMCYASHLEFTNAHISNF
jgi:hypothetical protein